MSNPIDRLAKRLKAEELAARIRQPSPFVRDAGDAAFQLRRQFGREDLLRISRDLAQSVGYDVSPQPHVRRRRHKP
jgi:hypothetical protein